MKTTIYKFLESNLRKKTKKSEDIRISIKPGEEFFRVNWNFPKDFKPTRNNQVFAFMYYSVLPNYVHNEIMDWVDNVMRNRDITKLNAIQFLIKENDEVLYVGPFSYKIK